MAEIPQDERKAGLDLANEVTLLAANAPSDFAERKLHAVAHALRRHYGYSRPLKKSEILRRLKKEELGIRLVDLKKETGFHVADVRELVLELEKEGKVTCKKVAPSGGRGGRPTLEIVLNHEV